MIRGLWVSASSLAARERAEEILANNLANVTTSGFRQVRFAFQQTESALKPPDLPGGAKAPDAAPGIATRMDLSEGSLETTGSPLDLALTGPGFFVVQGPEGPLYTREASLVRGADGTLLHRSGHPILTEGGPLILAEQSTLTVSPDGTVAVDGASIGRLQVVDLSDPSQLRHAGKNLIRSDQPGLPVLEPRVMQGVIEGANANPVETMIDMLAVLRGYEANQNAILTQDASLVQLIRWASS